ncbi:hypothetical protein Pla52o_17140 [Novipirellula galeiformis]|uniref:Right handed beta helix domain-containing protein n=1 Tax=Novipirellula galeiformis TaxID=2528004 RepID=A0A5C6CKL0_9BACT|nr:right-handed parallel beta-helix repeat-containing protein [Novipirellula galeiformis]TWU25413.1 hypothetical protein Pla52o_17140 [Novipirellula galeiformis]
MFYALRFLVPVAIGLTFAIPAFAHAANPIHFHVATDGSDTHAGTSEKPFATLPRAQRAVREARKQHPENAVTVEIRAGHYTLDQTIVFTPEDSGHSAANPVRYLGEADGEVVLSGGRAIREWKPDADHPGLWKTRIIARPGDDHGDWRFEQLWVNGRRGVRARTPNDGDFHMLLGVRETPIAGTKRVLKHTFAVQEGGLATLANVDSAALKDVQVVVYHKWDTTREWLQSAAPEQGLFSTHGEVMKGHNPMKRDCLYFLENYREALDAPGEWFLDREGWLYYRPRENEDMTTASVIAPVVSRLFDFQGEIDNAEQRVKHLRFEGLNLRHAEFPIPAGGIRSAQAAMNVDATAIQLDGAEDIRFSDCSVEHVGGSGFWFRKACRDCRVERTRVFDLGVTAVRIGETGLVPTAVRTGGITVDNCILQSGGRITPHAVGVWIGHSSDNAITHCDVADFFYTAVSVGWRWGYAESGAKRNRIEYNHLHHIGYRILSDMGGVYLLGPSEGTRVRNNVIHDVYATRYGGWGLYPDEGSSQILFENNLVYDVRDGGFHQHYGRENIVRNNILAFSEEGQVAVTRSEPHLSFTFERNLVFWDEGHLLGYSGWKNGAQVNLQHNLYWRAGGQPFDFAGKSWAQWREAGNDEGSIVADPLFVNAAKRDFRLRPGSPANQIGFVPFDISMAGVQGDSDWKQLAAATPVRDPFVVPTSPPINITDDFESDSPISLLRLAKLHHEGRASLITVVETPDLSGHCLRVQDAADLKASYNPHLYWDPNYVAGTSTLTFRIRMDAESEVVCEWRDRGAPYRTGPSLHFSGRAVHSRGQKLFDIAADTWVDVTMEAPQGKSNGRWSATFVLADGQRHHHPDLVCDPEWMETRWVGFISAARNASQFYLDDIKMQNRR